MAEKEENITTKISEELKKQFPDLKPKIAEVTGSSFIYELEKHQNYTYYKVRYSLSPTGTLAIDWDNAELTVF
jgi:ABC-type Zn2+ transport system substrate-binding protein/surface adhesin